MSTFLLKLKYFQNDMTLNIYLNILKDKMTIDFKGPYSFSPRWMIHLFLQVCYIMNVKEECGYLKMLFLNLQVLNAISNGCHILFHEWCEPV